MRYFQILTLRCTVSYSSKPTIHEGHRKAMQWNRAIKKPGRSLIPVLSYTNKIFWLTAAEQIRYGFEPHDIVECDIEHEEKKHQRACLL